jgi:hypothetical protein
VSASNQTGSTKNICPRAKSPHKSVTPPWPLSPGQVAGGLGTGRRPRSTTSLRWPIDIRGPRAPWTANLKRLVAFRIKVPGTAVSAQLYSSSSIPPTSIPPSVYHTTIRSKLSLLPSSICCISIRSKLYFHPSFIVQVFVRHSMEHFP